MKPESHRSLVSLNSSPLISSQDESVSSVSSISTSNSNSPSIQKRGLTIPEAAEYSGLTIWFLRTAVWNRKIPFILAGKRYVILRDDLDSFLEKSRYKVRQ